MNDRPTEIQLSVSTWRQPTPADPSAQRSALVAEVADRVLARGAGRLTWRGGARREPGGSGGVRPQLSYPAAG